MDHLDSDLELLHSFDGKRKASRDIVQFVPFRNFINDAKMDLPEALVAELPDQVVEWMEARGIKPSKKVTKSDDEIEEEPNDAACSDDDQIGGKSASYQEGTARISSVVAERSLKLSINCSAPVKSVLIERLMAQQEMMASRPSLMERVSRAYDDPPMSANPDSMYQSEPTTPKGLIETITLPRPTATIEDVSHNIQLKLELECRQGYF